MAVLFVELDCEILKVHAGRRRPGRVCAPEHAVPDGQASLRLDHPDPAHDLNPDVAAESREEFDSLRVTLSQGYVMCYLRIGLIHIPLHQELTGTARDYAVAGRESHCIPSAAC